MLFAAVPMCIAYRFVSDTDWSTEADARSVHVAIDESLEGPGGFPLGLHVDSSGPRDHKVEVRAQILADGRLYSMARDQRDDGYEVELWITFVPNAIPTARALVHWWDQSGSVRGFLPNLDGQVRLKRKDCPTAADLETAESPYLLEYELSGDQRDRRVTVHRKLIL